MPTIPGVPATAALRAPGELLERVRRDVERNALRARNGIKMAAGVDRPRLGQTPRDLVWSSGRAELWRYRSDAVTLSPPLLIVFSLVSRSYVLDLRPGNSFVEHLQAAGFDVFLLDWAEADERHAGERLEDHADVYLPEAVRRTCDAGGVESINLFGYCFGGVLCLLYGARHPDAPLRSLTVMATPVDFSAWGVWMEMAREGRVEIDSVIDETGNVPAGVIRHAFRLLKPTGDVRQYASLLENVWNDEYVAAYQAMTTWGNDHVPFPGAAARQTMEMLVRENAFVRDRLRLDGTPVSLRAIRWPMLTVIAERDHIVPEPVAAPLPGLVGSQESDVLRLDAGHVGLVVGRTAAKVTIPRIIEFLRRRSEPVAGSREGAVMAAEIVPLDVAQLPALRRFLDGLPDSDVTFIKEDVRDPATAEAWVHAPGGLRTWVAVGEEEAVAGIVSVRPLVGWSSHVGELRLVVDPAHRGRGLGRALAAHALRAALEAGLSKVVVEVVAEQEGAVRMFGDLGFRGEALLRDHIRDRTGTLRDLLVLAHDAGEEWSSLASVGIEGEVC